MFKPFRSHRGLLSRFLVGSLAWLRISTGFTGHSFRHLWEHFGRTDEIALITCLKNLNVSGPILSGAFLSTSRNHENHGNHEMKILKTTPWSKPPRFGTPTSAPTPRSEDASLTQQLIWEQKTINIKHKTHKHFSDGPCGTIVPGTNPHPSQGQTGQNGDFTVEFNRERPVCPRDGSRDGSHFVPERVPFVPGTVPVCPGHRPAENVYVYWFFLARLMGAHLSREKQNR